MNTCAIIPAAGLGTRLNLSIPKLLAPVTQTKTIWSLLRNNLNMVSHIHLIIAPGALSLVREALAEDLACGFVSLSIQTQPLGMGDAIFCGYPIWSKANRILVVWGDQAFVTQETFSAALDAHAGKEKTVSLPLARIPEPYVEYCFDNAKLIAVKQSRENELCQPNGLADVGTFVLSVNDLLNQWQTYQQQALCGRKTQEINFLPFLPYLSGQGWTIQKINVLNPIETRGINTPEDLLFCQKFHEDLQA